MVGVLLEGEPGQRTAAAVVLLQRRVQDAHHAARLQRPLAVEDGIVEHHAPVLLFFGQKVRRVQVGGLHRPAHQRHVPVLLLLVGQVGDLRAQVLQVPQAGNGHLGKGALIIGLLGALGEQAVHLAVHRLGAAQPVGGLGVHLHQQILPGPEVREQVGKVAARLGDVVQHQFPAALCAALIRLQHDARLGPAASAGQAQVQGLVVPGLHHQPQPVAVLNGQHRGLHRAGLDGLGRGAAVIAHHKAPVLLAVALADGGAGAAALLLQRGHVLPGQGAGVGEKDAVDLAGGLVIFHQIGPAAHLLVDGAHRQQLLQHRVGRAVGVQGAEIGVAVAAALLGPFQLLGIVGGLLGHGHTKIALCLIAAQGCPFPVGLGPGQIVLGGQKDLPGQPVQLGALEAGLVAVDRQHSHRGQNCQQPQHRQQLGQGKAGVSSFTAPHRCSASLP